MKNYKSNNNTLKKKVNKQNTRLFNEGLQFHIDGSFAIIDGYKKENDVLIIPDKIYHEGKEYLVKGITEYAFQNNTIITSVTTPSTLDYIGFMAFCGCINLVFVFIAGYNTTIDSCAFEGCSKLEKIELPTNIKCISESLFCGCSSLKKIILPPFLQEIDEFAFEDCVSLSSITFPDTLKYIEDCAFRNCKMIKEIKLPKYLESTGRDLFKGCDLLECLIIPENVKGIDEFAFLDLTSLSKVILDNKNVNYILNGNKLIETTSGKTILEKFN